MHLPRQYSSQWRRGSRQPLLPLSACRRNFDVGEIGGIQDHVQLLSSGQMPRKASRIIDVPPPEPRLQYGERSVQSTHDQGHPNRRFIAISSRAALAHAGQNQALDSGR
jgi:hypothetical protein